MGESVSLSRSVIARLNSLTRSNLMTCFSAIPRFSTATEGGVLGRVILFGLASQTVFLRGQVNAKGVAGLRVDMIKPLAEMAAVGLAFVGHPDAFDDESNLCDVVLCASSAGLVCETASTILGEDQSDKSGLFRCELLDELAEKLVPYGRSALVDASLRLSSYTPDNLVALMAANKTFTDELECRRKDAQVAAMLEDIMAVGESLLSVQVEVPVQDAGSGLVQDTGSGLVQETDAATIETVSEVESGLVQETDAATIETVSEVESGLVQDTGSDVKVAPPVPLKSLRDRMRGKVLSNRDIVS